MLGINIFWQGKGLKEIGYIKKKNQNKIVIKIDKKYFRPNEVDYLKGDASKALKKLNFNEKKITKRVDIDYLIDKSEILQYIDLDKNMDMKFDLLL